MRKYSPVLKLFRLRFELRPFATMATVAAVLLFVALGNWQLGRAAEKRVLNGEFTQIGRAHV